MSQLNIVSTTQEPDLSTAMKIVYQWNYGSEVEELRRLYVKGLEAQWIAERDLDWKRPIDQSALAATPLAIGFPVEQTSYWRSLSPETGVGTEETDGELSPEQLSSRRTGRPVGRRTTRERCTAY